MITSVAVGALLLQSVAIAPAAETGQAPSYIPSYTELPCRDDGCPSIRDRDLARKAAETWLEGAAQDGFVVNSVNATARYEDKTVKYEGRPDFRIINIHAYGGEWPTTLHFKAPVDSSMSPAEIQRRVQSFSHDGFPVPGPATPHWRIRALTQSSHVNEGIEILDVAPGLLKFRVRTVFLSLHGLDNRAEMVADAPTPPEAYFALRRPFAGEAVITYRISNF